MFIPGCILLALPEIWEISIYLICTGTCTVCLTVPWNQSVKYTDRQWQTKMSFLGWQIDIRHDNIVFIPSQISRSVTAKYRILPNKHACLIKRAPDVWFHPALSQKLLNWSVSNFQHLMSRYLRVPTGNESEIRVRVRFLPPCLAHLFGEIRYALLAQMSCDPSSHINTPGLRLSVCHRMISTEQISDESFLDWFWIPDFGLKNDISMTFWKLQALVRPS